jgi:hemerythrin-like metal-binding protein
MSSLSFLSEDLILDVDVIDCQHNELFGRLDALKALCVERNALPEVEAEALLNALVAHFSAEEKLARAAGLDFRAHGEKHQRMLEGIQKMLFEVVSGCMDVFTLLRYIDYWFERHIVYEDKLLALNLQQTPFSLEGQHFC